MKNEHSSDKGHGDRRHRCSASNANAGAPGNEVGGLPEHGLGSLPLGTPPLSGDGAGTHLSRPARKAPGYPGGGPVMAISIGGIRQPEDWGNRVGMMFELTALVEVYSLDRMMQMFVEIAQEQSIDAVNRQQPDLLAKWQVACAVLQASREEIQKLGI